MVETRVYANMIDMMTMHDDAKSKNGYFTTKLLFEGEWSFGEILCKHDFSTVVINSMVFYVGQGLLQ